MDQNNIRVDDDPLWDTQDDYDEKYTEDLMNQIESCLKKIKNDTTEGRESKRFDTTEGRESKRFDTTEGRESKRFDTTEGRESKMQKNYENFCNQFSPAYLEGCIWYQILGDDIKKGYTNYIFKTYFGKNKLNSLLQIGAIIAHHL